MEGFFFHYTHKLITQLVLRVHCTPRTAFTVLRIGSKVGIQDDIDSTPVSVFQVSNL